MGIVIQFTATKSLNKNLMSKEISRRTLLKAAVRGGTGLVIAVFLGCEEEQKIQTKIPSPTPQETTELTQLPTPKLETPTPIVGTKTPTPQLVLTDTPKPAVESPTPKPLITPTPRLEATPTSTPEVRSILTPGITYSFDHGVSAEDRKYILEADRLSREFLVANLGTDITGHYSVYVRAATSFSNSSRIARAISRYEVEIYTLHPKWAEYKPFERTKIMCHERFHLVQYELSDQFPVPGPTWLSEGSAEYVAYQAVINEGLTTNDEAKAFHIGKSKSSQQALPTLQSLETDKAWEQTPAYSLAYIAVELLVSGNAMSLRTYFEAFAKKSDWRSAFKAAFGMSSDSFYQKFEEYRQRL